jgi:hypothetical protein
VLNPPSFGHGNLPDAFDRRARAESRARANSSSRSCSHPLQCLLGDRKDQQLPRRGGSLRLWRSPRPHHHQMMMLILMRCRHHQHSCCERAHEKRVNHPHQRSKKQHRKSMTTIYDNISMRLWRFGCDLDYGFARTRMKRPSGPVSTFATFGWDPKLCPMTRLMPLLQQSKLQ